MPSRLKLLLIILLYLGSLNTVSANSTQYPAATLAKLAEDVQWQYLLHFRPTLTGLGKKVRQMTAAFYWLLTVQKTLRQSLLRFG